ncbi:hypothetical protein [Vibrio celticus]|uniref:hypothetical protein n=1 Tax=Vibrio celticus TaxID=446372 RepID=UPI0040689EDE
MINSNKLDGVSNLVIILALLSVVIAISIYSFYFYNYEVSQNPSEWASFGDFFGGVLNPVLSFLSLILVLVTIKQQKISLEQTSEQIKLSFDEMKKSVSAQEKQADLAESQYGEFVRKNKVDDIVKFLRDVLLDVSEQLEESVICFKDLSKEREFRSQIYEVIISCDDNFTKKFFKYHSNRVASLVSSHDYYLSLLSDLEKLERGTAHDYYVNKISSINQTSKIEDLKGKYNDIYC